VIEIEHFVVKPCKAPSGKAISRTGKSRLDNQAAALTICVMCSRLAAMSRVCEFLGRSNQAYAV